MERAEKHVTDFKTAIGIGPEAKNSVRASGIHLQRDGTLKYSTDTPEPGAQESIILGDAIHQLRSALDHLICAFVMRKHPRKICEDAKIAFPVTKSSSDFKAIRRISKGEWQALMGADVFALVEASQPYQRNPTHPTADPLYILSQLDNIDKHRIVIVFNQALATSGFVHQEGIATPFKATQPVKAGDQVLDLGVRLIPDKPVAYQMDNLTPHVTFAETDGICDGESVFPLFRDMQHAVTAIVADFAKLP